MAGERIAENEDCISELIDILGYEALSGRMSPEMQLILDRHLDACAHCRRRFAAFVAIARGAEVRTWVC